MYVALRVCDCVHICQIDVCIQYKAGPTETTVLCFPVS
jgi:hypothetical protein